MHDDRLHLSTPIGDAMVLNGVRLRSLRLNGLLEHFQLSEPLDCLVDHRIKPLVHGDLFCRY